MTQQAIRRATHTLRPIARIGRDYLVVPTLGLVVALVAREAVEAKYTAAVLYCWKGMSTLRLVDLAFLGLVAVWAYWRGRSRGWSAATTLAVAWNFIATAAVMAAVYVDAVLQRSCNE
jgi:hypothetical protein